MLFRVCTFLAVCGYALAAANQGRIIMGEDTDISLYPYQVAMFYNGAFRCGASILSNRWILTAAHCTDGIENGLSIRAGSTLHASGGQLVNVSEIHQHPRFDSVLIDWDVCLLKLETALEFNDNVNSIEIAASIPGTGTVVVVTGWGSENMLGLGTSPNLKNVTVSMTNKLACSARFLFQTTRRMFCAGAVIGLKGVCMGDSGGPIVYKGKQIGIVSWGIRGCTLPLTPAVYTNLGDSDIKQFVDQTLAGNGTEADN